MALVASGVRRESQQAKADPGHPAPEPGQADRLPVQVPQRPSGRRAVQRREGLSHQADQRVETFAGIGAWWAKVVRCLYCFGFTVSLFSPIPRTYTSSPLEGMARNYINVLTWICRITQFIVSGSIFPTSLRILKEKRKKHVV